LDIIQRDAAQAVGQGAALAAAPGSSMAVPVKGRDSSSSGSANTISP